MQSEKQLKASREEIDNLKTALGEHASVSSDDPQGKITYGNDKCERESFPCLLNFKKNSL